MTSFTRELSGTSAHGVWRVLCQLCVCVCEWRQSVGRLCSTCPTVSAASCLWSEKDAAPSDLIAACAFSVLRPWGMGVNVATNLDTFTETSPAALHLFITPHSASLSLSISCPAGLASLFLPALFFPAHPYFLFRDVNISDSGGHWNDTEISLSTGSLVTTPYPLWLLLHPLP